MIDRLSGLLAALLAAVCVWWAVQIASADPVAATFPVIGAGVLAYTAWTLLREPTT